MKEIGFVKIDRKILNWRWYKNINTFKLFMHLLLNANFCDAQFETHTIKRGQLVTGRKQLSADTGLSERQVRTALNNLKTTNNVTIKPTSKYSIITIVDYEKYLDSTGTLTNNRPANDQQSTSNRPQYKNNKKNKNNKNNYTDDDFDYDLELFKSKSLFKD